MKKVFTLFAILIATVSFAQTRPTGNTAPTTTTATKADALIGEWFLSKVEVASVEQDPSAQQRGDKLVLEKGGRYRLIYNGVAEGGTYTGNANATLIVLTSDAGVSRKFTVLNSSSISLKVDYKDDTGTHNIMVYTKVAPAATR